MRDENEAILSLDDEAVKFVPATREEALQQNERLKAIIRAHEETTRAKAVSVELVILPGPGVAWRFVLCAPGCDEVELATQARLEMGRLADAVLRTLAEAEEACDEGADLPKRASFGFDRLDEIEARARAATKGPWKSPQLPGTRWNDPMVCGWDSRAESRGAPYYCTGPDVPTVKQAEFDAVFMAHAREDVPWLVGQVRARAVEVESLKARADAAEKATREAFVAGAKWWEFESTGGTMWGQDQGRAHSEAERRFPHAPKAWEVALSDELEETERQLREMTAERDRLRGLLYSVWRHWQELGEDDDVWGQSNYEDISNEGAVWLAEEESKSLASFDTPTGAG